MKKIILLSVLGTIALVSCQKALDSKDTPSKNPVFTAGIEQTKTTLSIEGAVGTIAWNKGDTILITDADLNEAKYVAQQNGTRSSFIAVDGEPTLGAGPYTAKYNDMEKKQEYSTTTLQYLTMTAGPSESTDLTFSVTCGVLKLRLVGNGINIKNIMLKGPSTDLYYLYCGDGIDITAGVTFTMCFNPGSYKKIYLTNTDMKTAIYTLKDGSEIEMSANNVSQAAITNVTASQFDCIYLGSRVNGETNNYPVCWAECNIGAEHCYDAGYFFQWGDTTGYQHDGSKWRPYGDSQQASKSFSGLTPSTSIGTDNDAARYHMGGSWRMPLKTEVEKLVKYNDPNVWCENYKDSGKKGVEITGNTGAKLFIPAAGNASGNNWSNQNTTGFYWANASSYGLNKRPGFKVWDSSADKYLKYQDGGQSNGFPIRPVKD